MKGGIIIRGKRIASPAIITTVGGHAGLGMFPYVLSPEYLKFLKLVNETGTTQIVKSSTYAKRKGNIALYNPRTWQYVRRIGYDTLHNAHGHGNLGVSWNAFLMKIAFMMEFDIIPNFVPDFSKGIHEAVRETLFADRVLMRSLGDRYKTLELAPSCGNRKFCRANTVFATSCCIRAIKLQNPDLVVGVKAGIENTEDDAREWEQAGMEFFHVINSIPFHVLFPGHKSPMECVGGGTISGGKAQKMAFKHDCRLRKAVTVPTIFGCCNNNVEQAYRSFEYGNADAISFCTAVVTDIKEAEKMILTFNT